MSQPTPTGEHRHDKTDVDESRPDRETDVDERIAAIEREMATLRAAVRAGVDTRRSSVSGRPPDAEATTQGQEELANRVAEVIRAESQKTKERRIALAQDVDSRVIEAFASEEGVPQDKRDALEAILFAATRTHFELVEEGTNGERPWEEIRLSMEDSWDEGREKVRDLLEPEEYEHLAAIAQREGTLLPLAVVGDPGVDREPLNGSRAPRGD